MPDLRAPLEGFEDVTPIPQEDGNDPVVPIAYPQNCKFIQTGLSCVGCTVVIQTIVIFLSSVVLYAHHFSIITVGDGVYHPRRCALGL